MAKQEFIGYSPACRVDIERRLDEVGVSPNERIGQHFLVNQEAIDLLAQEVNQGGIVVEVGCGVGHVTERLAERAGRLYGIEIDRRYRPLLDRLTARLRNVSIIYRDALAVDFDRLLHADRVEEEQIIANLPYHITEPFIQKVAPSGLTSVTLVVGRRYADSIAASYYSGNWGRLSILTATFFDVEALATIQRDGFFPVPRTDSVVVRFIPRDTSEVGANRRDAVFRHLFLTSRRNSTLRRGLKEGFDAFEQSRDGIGLSKKGRNRKSRFNTKLRLREVLGQINREDVGDGEQSDVSDPVSAVSSRSRDAIGRLQIADITLDKPFSLLNNSELRMLYDALG